MKTPPIKWHFMCFIVISLACTYCLSLRIEEKMYDELQSDHYCIKRLNATHQFGCTSDPGGNVGTMWMVSGDNDFDHVLKNGPTPPYIVVSAESLFTTKNLLKFKASSGRISGVIVLKMNDSIPAFSPDSTHPNQYFGLYTNDSNKQTWQKSSAGSEMLFQDFPFPIFLITKASSIEAIEKCARHNQGSTGTTQAGWPLCGAQLDSFMMAAKNSVSCLMDRSTVDTMFQSGTTRCRYLNAPSIFSYYKPEISTDDVANPLVGNRSIVMLTARLDSMSMFKDYNPGADSPTTAIVSILAIADALVKSRRSDAVQYKDKNIAFALFNSESLEYTGSAKAVSDLIDQIYPKYPFTNSRNSSQKTKNMQLKSIEYLIELTQLAAYPKSDKIYIHTDPTNVEISKTKIDAAKVAFQNELGILNWADQAMPLPPASSQMFLKRDQEIATLVVSNHEKEFTNPYYNSIFDSSDSIFRVGLDVQAKHLATVSTAIARAAFELAFGQTDESIQANETFIGELLNCYLVDANCSFFNLAQPAASTGFLPVTGLNSFEDYVQRKMTQMSLAYILGEKLHTLNYTQCREESGKSPGYSYEFVKGGTKKGICIRSQTYETTAISPLWYYPHQNETNMIEYSGWTLSETNIRHPVRIFYQSSPLQDWFTFFLGSLVMVASFVLIHFGFNKWVEVAVEM